MASVIDNRFATTYNYQTDDDVTQKIYARAGPNGYVIVARGIFPASVCNKV